MSIPLFPPRAPQEPKKKSWPENALEPWVVREMVCDFLMQWDAMYPAITICHYPDHNGSLSVWDNHFAGEPR